VDDSGRSRRTDDDRRGYYYSERSGRTKRVLQFRAEAYGEPRTLLDVNTLDAKGLTSLDWWRPNEQGTLMAFGTSQKAAR
jgi:hypothetical protein